MERVRFILFPTNLKYSKEKILDNYDELVSCLDHPLFIFWFHVLPKSGIRSFGWSQSNQAYARMSAVVSVQNEAFAMLLLVNGLTYWLHQFLKIMESETKRTVIPQHQKVQVALCSPYESGNSMTMHEYLRTQSTPEPKWTSQSNNRKLKFGPMKKFSGWDKGYKREFKRINRFIQSERNDKARTEHLESLFQFLVSNRKLLLTVAKEDVIPSKSHLLVLDCMCAFSVISSVCTCKQFTQVTINQVLTHYISLW